MSRHRNVRGLEDDDYDEDDENQYGSYTEDLGYLSKSVEDQYTYNRGQGATPKMSSFLDTQASRDGGEEEIDFEMDIDFKPSPNKSDTSPQKLERRNSSFDTSRLSQDQLVMMNSALDHVLDVTGDSVPENVIKEAILKHNFDGEKTLNYVLTNPTGKEEKKETVITRNVPRSFNLGVKAPIFNAPTPVIKTPLKGAVISTGFTPRHNLDHAGVESLKIKSRSRSQSPSVPGQDVNIDSNLPTPVASAPSSAPHSGRATPTPAQASLISPTGGATPHKNAIMRKEKIDAIQEFKKERGEDKNMLNLVVIGHVDSGKSTLMGHLLFKLGNVSKKIMHKYEQESTKMGKQSFRYAWVLDETDEERNRGITMDVGQNKFETDHTMVTLLDAPGHRDFIPNMISGAYQADVAVLVVNGSTGEFESGFEQGGQTREHALLVRSLGVAQLVIAVNKLDTVNWDEKRFELIKEKLKLFLLKQAGYRDADLTFIPTSGLTGENLCLPPESPSFLAWYKGTTLIQAIDAFKVPERPVDKPFRLSVSDIFKSQSSGFSVAGRVEAGVVMKADNVLISPLNEVCSVKAVTVEDVAGTAGYAGDHVILTLVGPEQNEVSAGMVLSDPSAPIPVTARFQARLLVFNIDIPITKGYPVILHYGSVSEQATVKKLVSLLHKSTGEVVKSKPRCLTGSCSAVVEIAVARPIPLELYKNSRELGRIMLRSGGHTLAAGMVTAIL